MGKAFQIFRRDIKRLLRNPVALVITIGVCVIPSLYAWYNIMANWDPYGNTTGVKVAVANEDAGTENEYVGTLNAGEEVMDQLHENDQLGWTFVSADEAKQGVERGDYYAAVIIPSDFSENLTSMLTGDFTEPTLEYYVNEKRNAIAPKVTDKGASTIQEQVNETFVSTVSETLVKKLKEAGTEVGDKVDSVGAGMLTQVTKASDSLDEVRDGLTQMSGTIDKASRAITSADKTLSQLAGELPGLEKALDNGSTLLASTRKTSRSFAQSLSEALSQGTAALGSASAHASSAVGKVTGLISQAQVVVDNSANSIDGAASDIARVIEIAKRLDPTDSYGVQAMLSELQGNLGDLADGMHSQSSSIKDTSAKVNTAVKTLDKAVQTGIDNVSGAQKSIASDALPKLSSGLDSFSSVSGDLTGVVASLEPVIAQARGTLSELDATLEQAKEAVKQTDSNLAGVQKTLASVETDVRALRSSEVLGDLSDLLDMDATDVADFMASPVTLDTQTIYPVATYGSGVAPFYTNLALWVGGFVLIAIFKLEVDPEEVGGYSPNQGYFGRWLLFVLLGLVQAVIVCVGDLVLGVQCGQPVLFVLAGVWTSFVFVNIIYALSIAFKHIGKALGVILVIVQIPGSSGMYPIEMMPGFFQAIHPLLPFTYGINALRETIGGMYGASYLVNLGVLGIFLVLALLIGLVLRPLVLNLNLLFDRQLASTGVMICEKDDIAAERFSVRAAMRALLDAEGFRTALVARATRFERAYPRRVRLGFGLVFGLPVVLFILTSVLDLSTDGKIVMLVLWIVAIILADAYLITLEYMRQNLNVQMRVSALSDEGLRQEIREHTVGEPAVARAFGVRPAGVPAAGAAGSAGAAGAAGAGAAAGAAAAPAAEGEDAACRGKHMKGGDRA